MNLVTPLGLIALAGLLVLLLIYIIKPTYQSKVMSSTFIWRESLKYKTGKKPMSKLQNLLRVICQVLIITDCALMLATPLISSPTTNAKKENIVILDGSANMLYKDGEQTRFDKAVGEIRTFAAASLKNQEPLTVIYAGQKADYVTMKETSKETIDKKLSELTCTYAVGDYDGAMALADELCRANPLSNVYYYTADKIASTGDLHVVDMGKETDWNAGILDVRSTFEENYYRFHVDVAVYGADKYVNVYVTANHINGTDESKTATVRVNCLDGQMSTAVFSDMEIYEYDTVEVVIQMDDESQDGYVYDDSFSLLDGKKETIDIQYFSTKPNNFVKSSLMSVKNSVQDMYDLHITTRSPKDASDSIKYEGMDVYIFEHEVPVIMPTDGVVILLNPDAIPNNLKGVTLGSPSSGNFTMQSDSSHALMQYVNAEQITATTYKKITAPDFEHLMFSGNDSVYAVRNTDECKVAILTLNLNRSNLPMLLDFPVMFHNLFGHFMPSTINRSVYNVNEKIDVTARGTNVQLLDSEKQATDLTIPAEIRLGTPGRYSIRQTLIDKSEVTKDFYVRIPAGQSNPVQVNDRLEPALEMPELENPQTDIIVYLALGLIALILLERFLYSRENI